MPERQALTTLPGVVAPLLTVDTSDPRAVDYNSLYEPRQWKKSTPFVIDMMEIQPLGQSGLNLEMNFEIPKFATLMQDMCLRTVIPPSTVTPAGSVPYYADHLGFAIIDYFRINFGSNQVYTREKYDLYFQYRQALGIEKTFATNVMVFGDTTTAQRNALLVNGGELITPLELPFSQAHSQTNPLLVLSQKSRYVLKTNPLQNIIVIPPLPAGGAVTQTSPWLFTLRVMIVHTTGDESAFLLNMSQEPDGIAYMIHQNVRQNADDFNSFQTNFVINEKLSAMTKPLQILDWALIPTKLQNNTGRNDVFMFAPQPTPVPPGMTAYNPIDHWRIEANGLVIQRDINPLYNQYYLHRMYHESFPGNEIFFQTYSEFPHSVNAACGYLDYTNLNNPVLYITMGVGGTGPDPDNPSVPQSLRVIINAQDYNFWQDFTLEFSFNFLTSFSVYRFFNSGNWSRSFN